ncbi:MAG: peptidase S41 [Porphyrobacter sp.]|nr:peptidase S41 [Porphyrobacter sp.]
MKIIRTALFLGAVLSLCANTAETDYAEAARELDEIIEESYAYRDHLPKGELRQSEVLTAERKAVRDDRTLLAYAEKRLASLADHHAITGSSFRDSWAVVPTYADLWVVTQGDQFVVDAVRDGSPARAAGVVAGDMIIAVHDVPIEQAVALFWAELGLGETPDRKGYAARVLVAGRRDRMRKLTIRTRAGSARDLVLPTLYSLEQDPLPALSICSAPNRTIIRFNNSLDDFATVIAFDEALRAVPEDHALVLDLRDTPSGGNTIVARAIMGWFVAAPRGYQIHNRPAEERETGIPRQWVEQVLPRKGMHRAGLPTVVVGRWTGSMGEGIAVGFAALGAEVFGTRMAGLKGSVEDLRAGDANLSIKLPTERLLTTSGLPREEFEPKPLGDERLAAGSC